MSSVKTFHIRGEFKKRKDKIPFGKYVRALNVKDALEMVYSIVGSKHRVKRNMIFINAKDIKEITKPEEIKDIIVKTFATEDNLALPKRK
ncbi:MAG: 50S ribosomal protein L18a [Candidatus Heimdallarchaeota archaeon]|nr:50S ribosomal protein L18a [Candidatus Heimdallarchaeota archaeon]MCK4252822.1 50S ribosomal protein L18a [Candidatus Heimdallarchaeota archaeon]